MRKCETKIAVICSSDDDFHLTSLSDIETESCCLWFVICDQLSSKHRRVIKHEEIRERKWPSLLIDRWCGSWTQTQTTKQPKKSTQTETQKQPRHKSMSLAPFYKFCIQHFAIQWNKSPLEFFPYTYIDDHIRLTKIIPVHGYRWPETSHPVKLIPCGCFLFLCVCVWSSI